MYNDLPIEIRRRYTQEELDDVFNSLIGRCIATRHLYHNGMSRLHIFSTVIINDMLSPLYLNVDFSHSGDNKNARLHKIFFEGLLELYKDRITQHYNRYGKY